MDLYDIVVNFLGSSKGKPELDKVPEGLCPNCWGREEYGGKFYEAVEKEKIDLNNVMSKKGWIQAYAVEHFEGLKAKENDGKYECAVCQTNYKEV